MFVASRLTRNSYKSIVSPENITRIVNKAMEAPSSIPKAKPIPYGLRAKDGSYIPIRNKDEFIKVASEHPDFKHKVFAGASMKHLDIPRFNSHTLRHVAVAFIIAIGGAMAYKIHNNAYMRDVRADFPKFEYLHQRANQAVAELKARELAEIFAAEDAAEAAAAAAEDEE